MNTTNNSRRDFFMALLGLGMSCLVTRPARAGGKLAVVVHKDNPAGTLSAEDVKAHYLKKKAGWSNGEKIRPADQGPGGLRSGFLAKVLGMSAEDVDRYWIELKYVSAESPPKVFPDDAGVIGFVAGSKGAVGFVDAAAAAGAADKVKVVLTLDY